MGGLPEHVGHDAILMTRSGGVELLGAEIALMALSCFMISLLNYV